MNFRSFLENIDDPCSLYAIAELFPLPREEVVAALKQHGLGENGISLAQLTIVLDKLGIEWSVKNTRLVYGKTPKELQGKDFPGKHIVVLRNHVMPMLNGRLSNFCGYGDKPIQALITVGGIA